jgi:hypothetical protein
MVGRSSRGLLADGRLVCEAAHLLRALREPEKVSEQTVFLEISRQVLPHICGGRNKVPGSTSFPGRLRARLGDRRGDA